MNTEKLIHPISHSLKQRFALFFGLYTLPKALILGVILLGLSTLFLRFYESAKYTFLSYAGSPARAEAKERSLPTFIYIPSVEIALPIEETSIINGVWQAKQDAASHLSSSSIPTENGNIIIYSKRTDDQFGLLTSLTKGDEIIVTTQNGETHTYQVTDLLVVSPREVAPIMDTDSETLTLYTSYGFGDLKRFVVKATPLN